jgi:hypothetical protein
LSDVLKMSLVKLIKVKLTIIATPLHRNKQWYAPKYCIIHSSPDLDQPNCSPMLDWIALCSYNEIEYCNEIEQAIIICKSWEKSQRGNDDQNIDFIVIEVKIHAISRQRYGLRKGNLFSILKILFLLSWVILNVYMYTYTYTQIHTHTYIYIYMYIYACVCVCVCRVRFSFYSILLYLNNVSKLNKVDWVCWKLWRAKSSQTGSMSRFAFGPICFKACVRNDLSSNLIMWPRNLSDLTTVSALSFMSASLMKSRLCVFDSYSLRVIVHYNGGGGESTHGAQAVAESYILMYRQKWGSNFSKHTLLIVLKCFNIPSSPPPTRGRGK